MALGSSYHSRGVQAPQLEYQRHGVEVKFCNGLLALPNQRFVGGRGQIPNPDSIRREAITVVFDQCWSAVVDHGKSFEQLLEEGKYCRGVSYDDVVKRFPSRKMTKVTVEMHLVTFEREVTSQEVIGGMSARRLRPATIKEFLVGVKR